MSRLVAIIVACFAFFAVSFSGPGGQAAEALDVEAIEKIVKDYLLNNPEVIIRSIRDMDKRRQIAEDKAASDSIVREREDLLNDPNSFVEGPDDADVTIVEFFDYRCPYCKRSLKPLMNTMEADPKVRVVFKEFPILGEDSVTAARAAIASISQGRYLVFHNALMSSSGTLSEERVLAIAADVGLDVVRLKRDMDGEDVAEIIRANYALAEALGVSGTPAFIIGKRLIPGAITQKQIVEFVKEARNN